MEVFSGGPNIAPQGKAKQSSTEFDGEAERAIDGRTDGRFSAGTSSHSREMENYPWWELDLGTAQPIDRITIWNRTDADLGRRLNAANLTVLDEALGAVYVSRSLDPHEWSDDGGAVR